MECNRCHELKPGEIGFAIRWGSQTPMLICGDCSKELVENREFSKWLAENGHPYYKAQQKKKKVPPLPPRVKAGGNTL